MKIYVNLDSQPPTLATSLSVRSSTDSNAVRSYSVSGNISSFEFKRGTTVPLEIVLVGTSIPAANEISALRFALKPASQFDIVVSAIAEADVSKTVQNNDGTLSFFASLPVVSVAIDEALSVNGTVSDDSTNATFNAEISWENSAGETSASKTYSATISNNIHRAGDAVASDLPAGLWTSAMVVFLTWEEFCAMETLSDNVFYYITNKPSGDFDAEISEAISTHNTSTEAHSALFSSIDEEISSLQASVDDIKTQEIQTNSLVETANANASNAVSSATSALEKVISEAVSREEADTALQTQITTNANGILALKTQFAEIAATDAVSTTTAELATNTGNCKGFILPAKFARDGLLVSASFPTPANATNTKKSFLCVQQSATGTSSASDWTTIGYSNEKVASQPNAGGNAIWTFSNIRIEAGKAIRFVENSDQSGSFQSGAGTLYFYFEETEDTVAGEYYGADNVFYSPRLVLGTLNYAVSAATAETVSTLQTALAELTARVATLENAGTQTTDASAS